jgi:hypothetical protein
MSGVPVKRRKIPPEKAVQILEQHGTAITLYEATIQRCAGSISVMD